MSRLRKAANAGKLIVLKSTVSAFIQDHFVDYFADVKTVTIILRTKAVNESWLNNILICVLFIINLYNLSTASK